MKKTYDILLAEKSDIGSWMRLVDIVGADFPGLDKDEYGKILADNIRDGTAICAKEQGQVVGILLFSLENAALSFIAVHPDFRCDGIASALIGEMRKKFPPKQEIWVTTFRDDDKKGEAARLLYKKIGFAEDELVEEFGYPCQKLVLRT